MKNQKEETRGRPITCRYCGKKFKLTSESKRQKWVKSKFPCPHCKTTYSFLTETEKKLQIIQEKYKENKDEKYINEMHDILVSYAASIIKKHYINLIQDKDLLIYYAESATSLLIESDFLKKEDFYIEVSFGSRLRKKCLQAIMSVKESVERGLPDDSLDFILQDGNTVEHEDKKVNVIDNIEKEEEKYLLCQKLCSLIYEMEEHCESNFENYVRLINVLNFLKGGEVAIDKFFQSFGRYGKLKTMQTLDIIKRELKRID